MEKSVDEKPPLPTRTSSKKEVSLIDFSSSDTEDFFESFEKLDV